MKCVDCIDESVMSTYLSNREEAFIYPTDSADTIFEGNALCVDHLLARNKESKRTSWWETLKTITIRRSS